MCALAGLDFSCQLQWLSKINWELKKVTLTFQIKETEPVKQEAPSHTQPKRPEKINVTSHLHYTGTIAYKSLRMEKHRNHTQGKKIKNYIIALALNHMVKKW